MTCRFHSGKDRQGHRNSWGGRSSALNSPTVLYLKEAFRYCPLWLSECCCKHKWLKERKEISQHLGWHLKYSEVFWSILENIISLCHDLGQKAKQQNAYICNWHPTCYETFRGACFLHSLSQNSPRGMPRFVYGCQNKQNCFTASRSANSLSDYYYSFILAAYNANGKTVFLDITSKIPGAFSYTV